MEATKYNVFPLDNSIFDARPDAAAERDRRAERLHLFRRDVRSCRPAMHRTSLNRSYTITADVEIPQGGGEGMLATMGGRFGGYGLYLLKGKPVFLYNLLDARTLPLGRSGGAHAGQAHHRVRLHLRWTRLWQGRNRRAESGRQGSRQPEDPAHHPVHRDYGRDLRCRGRYPHRCTTRTIKFRSASPASSTR